MKLTCEQQSTTAKQWWHILTVAEAGFSMLSIYGRQHGMDTCRIPDDCIDSKRYPLFMAREVMRQLIDNLCVTPAVHPGALS